MIFNGKKYERQFETEFAKRVQAKYAVSFSYGRNALFTLIKALQLESSEIIIPAFTCSSIPEAIIKAGANPILVDVDNSFTIDPQEVEKKISTKTKAIYAIHTFGNPADINKLVKIAKENHLLLIEDVAHALGSKYNQKLVGGFGDFALYSLTKNMYNFGGAVITTGNTEVKEKLIELRDRYENKTRFSLSTAYFPLFRFIASFWDSRGNRLARVVILSAKQMKSLFSHKEAADSSLFSHFKMGYLSSKLALSQLNNLDKNNLKRKKLAHFFQEQKFKDQKVLIFSEPVYTYYPFLLNSRLRKKINSISTIKLMNVWGCHHQHKDYVKKYGHQDFPITEQLCKNLSIISCSPNYSLKEARKLVNIIKKYYN